VITGHPEWLCRRPAVNQNKDPAWQGSGPHTRRSAGYSLTTSYPFPPPSLPSLHIPSSLQTWRAMYGLSDHRPPRVVKPPPHWQPEQGSSLAGHWAPHLEGVHGGGTVERGLERHPSSTETPPGLAQSRAEGGASCRDPKPPWVILGSKLEKRALSFEFRVLSMLILDSASTWGILLRSIIFVNLYFELDFMRSTPLIFGLGLSAFDSPFLYFSLYSP